MKIIHFLLILLLISPSFAQFDEPDIYIECQISQNVLQSPDRIYYSNNNPSELAFFVDGLNAIMYENEEYIIYTHYLERPQRDRESIEFQSIIYTILKHENLDNETTPIWVNYNNPLNWSIDEFKTEKMLEKINTHIAFICDQEKEDLNELISEENSEICIKEYNTITLEYNHYEQCSENNTDYVLISIFIGIATIILWVLFLD